MNPYKVVQDFESALCEYTGAKYAVTTTSCTAALLLACEWYRQPGMTLVDTISIPKQTYVSVPQSITRAGFKVAFEDYEWEGKYPLSPLPIVDSARLFTSGMYLKYWFHCVSFHWSKTLAIGQGGAILHDNDEADAWFRKMRFDGRTEGVAPKDDESLIMGHHCYMSPRDAAEGLSRLAVLPRHNDPLPNDDYPDLSTLEMFK